MSHRRETVNGGIPGGSVSTPQRGDSFANQSKNGKSPFPRRARTRARLISEEEIFHEEAESSDRYIITYADLITLLLGLFILLYAFSNVDLQKYRKVVQAAGQYFGTYDSSTVVSASAAGGAMMIAKSDPFKRTKELIKQSLDDNQLNKSVQLIQTDRGFTIRILDDILFISGKAELTEYSKIILKKLAPALRTLPNDIRIEGHTDNIPMLGGGFASNWHLSVARATNTAFYLMDKEALQPGRVSVVGYAEYHPIAKNDSPEGRSNNRRVDIVILN